MDEFDTEVSNRSGIRIMKVIFPILENQKSEVFPVTGIGLWRWMSK